MADEPLPEDDEVAAIAAINTALSKLADATARRNVLAYINARYLRAPPASAGFPAPVTSSVTPSPLSVVEHTQQELPGIARLTEAGDLKITVRNLKAKNTLDAAVRLAHIAIYAHARLTDKPLSSRKGLTPILKEWRLYDGNTRARLAKEKGIVRDGDALTLDTHAQRDAERYIEEVLNEELTGQWKPR